MWHVSLKQAHTHIYDTNIIVHLPKGHCYERTSLYQVKNKLLVIENFLSHIQAGEHLFIP